MESQKISTNVWRQEHISSIKTLAFLKTLAQSILLNISWLK